MCIKYFLTEPYTPRTNGKAERFIQTALRGFCNRAALRKETALSGASSGLISEKAKRERSSIQTWTKSPVSVAAVVRTARIDGDAVANAFETPDF